MRARLVFWHFREGLIAFPPSYRWKKVTPPSCADFVDLSQHSLKSLGGAGGGREGGGGGEEEDLLAGDFTDLERLK